MQYVWYNAQDTYFYENDSNLFDGIAINAHTLAHNTKAFLALEIELQKPFFILPDIHYLQFYSQQQFDNTKGGIRASWDKLRRSYPQILGTILDQRRALSVADLSSQDQLRAFALGILDFQRGALARPFQLLRRLMPPTATLPRPNFLVAPYYYFETTSDVEYNVALNLNRMALSLKGGDRLFGVVFCSTAGLGSAQVARISNDFSQINCDGFLIWVNDFDEHEATQSQLSGLVELVRRLSSSGKEVINLYGSHFSVLMKYFGLDGIGSGICVRDSLPARPVGQMGGPAGGPVGRYYIPKIYKKFVQEDARRLIGQLPHFICDCDICSSQQVLNLPNQLPQERANVRRLMRRHFLRIRSAEIQYVNSTTGRRAIDDLNSVLTQISGPVSTVFELSFMRQWHDVLRSNLVV